MNRALRVAVAVALATMVLLVAGCDKLKARDQLNKGVQQYKAAHYEAAIDHFKNAVALDPRLLNARLYLATAYANQYVPGVDSPDNNRNAELAIEQFQEVLKLQPGNLNSLKGIAALYFQMKKFEESKEFQRQVIQNDPNDPEAYYSIAVIDWTQTYVPRMEGRAKLGMKPDEPLEDKKFCAEIRAKNEDKVREGMEMLQKAIQLRPDYEDAMAYLNLMYRERADYECEDKAARAADLKTADEWVQKTMDTKKAKAAKQQGPGGIVLDQPQTPPQP
jgi:tetratricopeptide (TPR) repeat protein